MVMHPKYLPFTEERLLEHFAEVKIKGEWIKNPNHLNYYKESIERYVEFLKNNPNRIGMPLKETSQPCQIEKDERFWIASCLMTIYEDRQKREKEFIDLFNIAFNKAYKIFPKIKDINSWDNCFGENLHLFFEANLQSPILYRKWLSCNLHKRHFIPYILDSAKDKNNKEKNKERIEGPTNVDAMLLNSKNGFAVIIEGKVLADIAYQITYDTMRNQIARSIDVMLEKNEKLCPLLNKRDPQKTLFLLITPKLFKENHTSRLYGYKFWEYKNKPESLAKDLPHRKNCDWKDISSRLGWITWEDFQKVNSNCCSWLKDLAS